MEGLKGTSNPVAARRALVAGGAGFIGAHLCERLLKEGYEVLVVDNLATGSIDNIRPLMGRGRIRFIKHDVMQPLELRSQRNFDLIFNLACCASPMHYQEEPVKTLCTCIDGALHLLDMARICGARVFQASTSEVYGEPEIHPQHEQYRGAVNPIGPRACYDEGKRCAETLFFEYYRQYDVDIKVARIFNTYGPRMQVDDGRVVSNLIVQALRNQPLTIHGDGSQTRSFCYVDDLVDGIMLLMASPRGFTGPVNLGNPNEATVLDLAHRIIEMTGARSRITHRAMPVDDPTRRCPDIALARSALGWAPEVSLDEGLRRTIAWFEEALLERMPVHRPTVVRPLVEKGPLLEQGVNRGAA
jgi:UDP-glucuronate decarboxylase